MITLTVRISGGPALERVLAQEVTDAVAAIAAGTNAEVTIPAGWKVTEQPSIRFRPTSGFIECPGSYMGNHTNRRSSGHGMVADCAYCQNTVRTVHYGHNLKSHWVPAK